MKFIRNALTVAAGGVVFAIVVYMLLAMPILLSDWNSTVATMAREAAR